MKKIVINEELLQHIEMLKTVLRNNIAGMFGGNRQSKSYGSSSEFADYRDYTEGDDVSKIDWNAYARFEELYMKLYLDERQMHTKIYIDASRSMSFGSGVKAEQALKLAAAFAYISVCEMDRVSVYVIKNDSVVSVIDGMVGKDAYVSSIGKLNSVEFDSDSAFSDALLPTNVGYGDGMTVLISDFLTDNDYEMAIDRLVDRKRDLLCVQILAEEELSPPIRGKSHLIDSENKTRFFRKNIDRDIIAAYKRAVEYVKERIFGYCSARGASYVFAKAESPVSEVLFGELVNSGVIK